MNSKEDDITGEFGSNKKLQRIHFSSWEEAELLMRDSSMGYTDMMNMSADYVD